MKKLSISIILLVFVLCLIGCSTTTKEYTGKRIKEITYITIDYNGGYTTKQVLNFDDNKYYSLGYLPGSELEPELELKNTFTDNEEKVFMDLCYTYGLFNLKESYKRTGIIDGGGWNFIIEYEDGSTKASKGSNDGPYKVFNKCATVFYDLCGYEVMGRLPSYYINPPQISYAFGYQKPDVYVSGNDFTKIVRADYKWNKSQSLNNDLYLINEENKGHNNFVSDYVYTFTLYTANYDCDEKFEKAVVKQYDYNSELSNEKIFYTGKWFKQIELDIELNKIYVYELYFKDGDYVQYTFSTYCSEK